MMKDSWENAPFSSTFSLPLSFFSPTHCSGGADKLQRLLVGEALVDVAARVELVAHHVHNLLDERAAILKPINVLEERDVEKRARKERGRGSARKEECERNLACTSSGSAEGARRGNDQRGEGGWGPTTWLRVKREPVCAVCVCGRGWRWGIREENGEGVRG